ncbi:MAG: DMT family transporter [Rhodospirillales bacterium]
MIDNPAQSGLKNDPLKGALYMTAFAVTFGCVGGLVRLLSEHMDPLQVVFLRNFFGLLCFLPVLITAGPTAFRTQRLGMHMIRALVGLAAMCCQFYALAVMPIALATAYSFSAPLFATLGAALFLGESLRARRMAALVVGFVGMLIMVRPPLAGFSTGFDPWALVAVGSAVFMAGALLSVKALSRTESPRTIVLYMATIMTVLSLLPAIPVWRWPTAEVWLLAAFMGTIATAGQVAMARALKVAEAGQVLNMDFTRLIASALVGYLLFSEIPDLWTWIGATVILASSIYIAQRETHRGKASSNNSDAVS